MTTRSVFFFFFFFFLVGGLVIIGQGIRIHFFTILNSFSGIMVLTNAITSDFHI
jgi:hypothetical protein